jgi:hypothetical protein
VSFQDVNTISNLTISGVTVDDTPAPGGKCTSSDGGGCSSRAISFTQGIVVNGLTVENSQFKSLEHSAIYAATSTVSNAVLRGNSFTGLGSNGFVTSGSASFANLEFDGNTFTRVAGEAFTPGASAEFSGLSFRGNRFSDLSGNAIRLYSPKVGGLEIEGNEFSNVHAGTGVTDATIVLPLDKSLDGEANAIRGNRFDNGGASGSQGLAIYWNSNKATSSAAAQPAGLFIEDNHFDGYSAASVRLYGTGLVTVRRNTFGAASGSRANTVEEESSDSSATMVDNYGSHANREIMTWRPDTAGAVTLENCELKVPVLANNGGTAPTTPVTLDFYWTAANTAEKYLGSVENVTAAGVFAVPVLPPAGGYLRLQTQGKGNTAQPESSQYSRVIPNVAQIACEPELEIDLQAWQDVPDGVADYDGILQSAAKPLPDAVRLPSGATVWFTYTVRNPGNIALRDVAVRDSHLAEVCEIALIPAGGSAGCARQQTVPSPPGAGAGRPAAQRVSSGPPSRRTIGLAVPPSAFAAHGHGRRARRT